MQDTSIRDATMSDPAEPTVSNGAKKAPKPPKEKKPFLGRTTRLYHKLHLPPVKSRRGILLIVLVVAGIGSIATMVGLKAIGYSESSAFCGKCHTMAPELRAYKMAAHSEIPCADCHVEPGAAGFIKAKIKGTQQLIEVVTGTFPRPIPPPEHSSLPPVQDTCLKCHSLRQITSNGGQIQLILRPHFLEDKANTGQTVAVVLRPQGLANATNNPKAAEDTKGVHWHVLQNVTYLSSDPRTQTIDYVNVTNKDGTHTEFISAAAVKLSGQAGALILQLKQTEQSHTMTCLDCHNRAGHSTPSTSQAMDTGLGNGSISRNLPYIKKEGMALLDKNFATLEEANTAIDGLRGFYAKNYPAVAKHRQAELTASIASIKAIYALLATPEMKVYSSTYPDNLGHQKSPGCFRCHDGAHYEVINGVVSTQVIPSTCSTCHTFPQIGGQITSLMLSGTPSSHNSPLWVFNHKNSAAAIASARNATIEHSSASVDPAGTTCGTCHEKSYCEACHKSGAINVSHSAMLFNHAAVIRQVGGTTACATCHQVAQCARCHKSTNVLKPQLS